MIVSPFLSKIGPAHVTSLWSDNVHAFTGLMWKPMSLLKLMPLYTLRLAFGLDHSAPEASKTAGIMSCNAVQDSI